MLQKADVGEILAAEARRGRSGRTMQMAIAAVAVLAALAVGFWLWSMWRTAATTVYLTDAATRGDITVQLVATGTLEPTQTIGVSSLATGTIVSVDVDYNAAVTKGQQLARLDSTDLAAAQRRAEAAKDAAAANRDVAAASAADARAALQRADELGRSQRVSSKELELAASAYTRAMASLAAAEAQLRAADADLEGARANLAKAAITAPIDGIVLDVNAKVGQTVGSATIGTPLFTIASDLRQLDLEVDIDEADIPQIAEGDAASFTVEAAPDETLAGTIRQVRSSPTVSDGVTSYVAVISVDNASSRLKPGMTATADITTDEAKDVLTVPNAALRFVPPDAAAPPADQAHVYVLSGDKPRLVPVTVGISNGQRTVIATGEVAPGDPVITGIKGR